MHIILHVMQENQINFEIFFKLQFPKQRKWISAIVSLSFSLALFVKKARIYLILKHLLQKAKYVWYFNTLMVLHHFKPVAHWDATKLSIKTRS